jgi:hypothetical protein
VVELGIPARVRHRAHVDQPRDRVAEQEGHEVVERAGGVADRPETLHVVSVCDFR